MSNKYPVFVVHKHDATRLHYDFRLQIGDVMPSWAIAKGPTLDNTKKRLAIQVDDHSLAHRNFEGVHGPGYGAGPKMIWDEGYYIAEIEVAKGVRKEITDFDEGQKAMKEGMEKGEIKFFLHGKKLKGSFALVKTPHFGPKNSWLLIKHEDEFVKPNYDANEYDFSARSGKSIEEVRKEG